MSTPIIEAKCRCGKTRNWQRKRLAYAGWVFFNNAWVCDYCVRSALDREGRIRDGELETAFQYSPDSGRVKR